MENSLYVGLSRQMVLQRAMDLTANNVANINTPGYREQNPIFEEYISKSRNEKEPLSMVFDSGQYASAQSGPIQLTGGTYDVALSGPGFIGVKTQGGEIQYTRAGNFTTDSNGQLVTTSGFTVAGSGGSAITIPAEAKEVVITESGNVTVDGNAVGKLTIDEFESINDLQPEGNGLYSALRAGRPATETIVKQGYLEGSNVNSVVEMSRMIDILRQYQSTIKMLNSEHERQSSAIQRLAKISGN